MIPFRFARLPLVWLLGCALVAPAAAATPELEGWIKYLDGLLPGDAAGYKSERLDQVAHAADAVEEWSVYAAAQMDGTPASTLDVVRQLLSTKARVDQMLDNRLAQRTQFASLESDVQRDAIRNYLRVDSKLIELSGRLRYLLFDVLQRVAGMANETAQRSQLLGLFNEFRSSIGATAAVAWLADPPRQPTPPAPRLGARLRAARQAPEVDNGQLAVQLGVLRLIAASGEAALLPRVAEFIRQPDRAAELVLTAAETIRTVGLPQDVRPGTPAGVPAPAITAAELYDRLSRLDASRLSGPLATRRGELLAWLDARRRTGLADDHYTLGSFQVQPGDWLLMRNPSPYNLFTDLSPGLFTHVGVVTTEQGADGIRRMVLVDLQEQGRMSTINVEIFVQRTLHYVFLRHPDPVAARQMAEAARSVIGNETEFDLNFRTERMLELAHQPLAGQKIRTYCAGLLLLCALQTSADRQEFFPVVEYAAGGFT
ncbi:MAG TPA: hypothetical protein VHY20_12500, partial [Pirellulales bacterium]|nr:hypothetical protein [Pirellulales bacterium]